MLELMFNFGKLPMSMQLLYQLIQLSLDY